MCECVSVCVYGQIQTQHNIKISLFVFFVFFLLLFFTDLAIFASIFLFSRFLHDSNIDNGSHSNVNEVKCSNSISVLPFVFTSIAFRALRIKDKSNILEWNKMWIYEFIICNMASMQ